MEMTGINLHDVEQHSLFGCYIDIFHTKNNTILPIPFGSQLIFLLLFFVFFFVYYCSCGSNHHEFLCDKIKNDQKPIIR